MIIKINEYLHNNIIKLDSSWNRRVFRYIIGAFFVMTVLAIFVPFYPSMPSSGLDPSWVLDMNQAVSQGFNFGEDIIFTYGPYASIYTKAYHPATYQMMIWGSLFLAIGYIIAVIYLSSGISVLWVMVVSLFLPLIYKDIIFFSYPFILALIVYRVTLPKTHPKKLDISHYDFIGIFISFFSLGLLPATKGTMLIMIGGVIILSALMLWINNQKFFACTVVLAPILSFTVFWSLAGQALGALPHFFISLSQIISGYAEAMSIAGNTDEVFLFLGVALVILFTILVDKPVALLSKTFLFFAYLLFLFVGFKSGFVRHDAHALIAGGAIVFSALLLPFVIRKQLILPSLILAVFAWSVITSHYSNNKPKALYSRTVRIYRVAWQGLQVRFSEQDFLNEKFDSSLASIRDELAIPSLEGTTDIYSFNQAYLIASNNVWSPRPVMQSYSAYTPLLAKLNNDYLKSDNAPDNILFKIEPIDERLPALEDGLSWPTIINRYSIQSFIGPYIHFQKRISYTANEEMGLQGQPITIYEDMHVLNNWVELPDTQEPLFAELIIKPTTLGKIYAMLYKPPEMRMSLISLDGKKKDFKVVTTMLKSRFLLSPLIESTEDFVFLTGEQGYLDGRTIQRIKVYPTPSGDSYLWRLARLWEPYYKIKLSTQYINNDTDFMKLYVFDEVIDERLLSTLDQPLVQCEGSVDQVNGSALSDLPVTVSNVLAVNGWMAINPSEGILPDGVLVTLTDEQGKRQYIKAQMAPRSDLANPFSQPAMLDAGYKVYVDVSELHGTYTLGLARSYEGVLANCKNFSVRLNIESK